MKNPTLKISKFKNVNIIFLIVTLVCSSSLLSSCSIATVVKNGAQVDSIDLTNFDEKTFNADKYVDSIWNSTILTEMNKKATDITTIISGLKSDKDGTSKKYGVKNGGDGNPYNFIVKGSGKVINVNKKSRNGRIDIDLAPYDNKADLQIQVGPVYQDSSIRDSVDFLKFEKFKNQIIYASISDSINKKVDKEVTSKLDYNSILNKEVEFSGSFTYDGTGSILITPTKLELSGGSK